MLERQLPGVEKLPLQAKPFSKAPVESKIAMLLVHDDGIAEPGEMEADLVQAAGVYFRAHQRRLRKVPRDTIARQCSDWIPLSPREWKIDVAVMQG